MKERVIRLAKLIPVKAGRGAVAGPPIFQHIKARSARRFPGGYRVLGASRPAGRAAALVGAAVIAGSVALGCAADTSGGSPRNSAGSAAGPRAGPADVHSSETGASLPTAVAVASIAGAAPEPVSIDTNLVVDNDITVTARMGGIVGKIFVDRGSRVRTGDPLLERLNRDLTLLLRRAEIALQQKTSDFERIRQLHTERTVPDSLYEESQLALERARVEVEMAREELEKSTVRAPFGGVIVDRFARVGQKVIEDDNTPLFRLTTMSPLLARLYLPEDLARQVSRGDRVEVVSRHEPFVTVAGVIQWISPAIDASSGTSLAIVTVPGGDSGRLSPGTGVTVVLHPAPAGKTAVLIPAAALEHGTQSPSGKEARVEVIENGQRSWRRVRLGEIRGDQVEVLDGLAPGDRVAVIPPARGTGEVSR